jgi:hypothetical protein
MEDCIKPLRSWKSVSAEYWVLFIATLFVLFMYGTK